MEEIDSIAKEISAAVQLRYNFPELKRLMAEILSNEERIIILSRLFGRLPGIVMVTILLVNLDGFTKLSDDEYEELFTRCRANPIGIYDLTRFFIAHGNVRGKPFLHLCEMFPEIDEIDQFKERFEAHAAIVIENQTKFNGLVYRELQVSEEDVAEFRRRVARSSFFNGARPI